jgi:MFS family permease
VFRSPPILALLTSVVTSSTGSLMTALALPWFVLVSSGSASRAAYVVGAGVLAYGLVGIPSGSVAAWLGARQTMLICDFSLALVVVGLIPALHWTGLLSPPVLICFAFVSGAISTPYLAAQQVVLPEVLGEDGHLITKRMQHFRAQAD